MKSILYMFLVFASAITAVTPCSALELFEKDHGRDITMCPGEELSIRLPGNPTTGYLWEVVTSDSAVLNRKGEAAFVADADRVGAGGQSIFRFTAGGDGSVRLRLVYRRPWEKEIHPIKVFEVVVTVKRE